MPRIFSERRRNISTVVSKKIDRATRACRHTQNYRAGNSPDLTIFLIFFEVFLIKLFHPDLE